MAHSINYIMKIHIQTQSKFFFFLEGNKLTTKAKKYLSKVKKRKHDNIFFRYNLTVW